MPLLAKSVLIVLFFAGWYGAIAGYSTAYDQGRKDALADKSKLDYDRGAKDGKEAARRELSQESLSSVEVQVKAKVQQYEEQVNQQLNARINQAYQTGASDYARKVIDHDMQFVTGPNKKENQGAVKK